MICYIRHIKRSNGFVDENGIQLKTFTKKFMENNRKIHPTTVNEIPTVSGGNLIIDSFVFPVAAGDLERVIYWNRH